MTGGGRAAAALALLAGLAALPFLVGGFALSVLTLIFLFAYLGQAWNVMMGLAGQLSLGHALYIGLGGYAVGLLSTKAGVSPWVGIPAGALLSAAVGALTGALGFRFAVRGVYFALLTIAFAEFARVLFDNWSFVGGSGGLFLPAVDLNASPLATLRGGTRFYYWLTLALAAGATLLVALLLRRRVGYLWRAIREDEDAARALGVRAFRLKIAAVALSAAMTSVGGSVFALMNGSLFPDTVMGMRLSIEIIIAPIIGGLGTVFGPVLGAALVIPLMEAANALGQRFGVFGLSTLAYGLAVLLVITLLPDGIWPALVRRFGRSPLRAPRTLAAPAPGAAE